MRPTRTVLIAILALVGLLWIGQGLGFLPGTVMRGSPFWAAMGVLLVVGAAVLLVLERRRR